MFKVIFVRRAYITPLLSILVAIACLLANTIAIAQVTNDGAGSSVASSQDYSLGMRAYTKSDYVLAQSYWLKAAEANNPKAMFNLGLLHQNRLIANSEESKAEQWFRLAGKSGYVAADYHMGVTLLNKDGRQSEARQLLSRAANNGYVPAKQKLAQVQGHATKNNHLKLVPVSNAEKIPVIAVNKNDLTRENTEQSVDQKYSTPTLASSTLNTAKWILSRPASDWTIQLIAFPEKSTLENFISENKLSSKVAYFKEVSKQKTWYKIVYGSYSSKALASEARNKLPDSLKEYGPWLRSMGSVQETIK